MQRLAAVLLLCLFWFALPVRLPHGPAGSSSEQCLTVTDSPPVGSPSVSMLEHCRLLYPDDVELMADLASQYEAAGRLPDAEAMYRRALTIDPAYADLRLRFGRLMLERGDASGAAEQAEAALKVQPNRQALVELLKSAQAAGAGKLQ